MRSFKKLQEGSKEKESFSAFAEASEMPRRIVGGFAQPPRQDRWCGARFVIQMLLDFSHVVVAKWSKHVKVRTFGETNPKNTKRLQTKFKLMRILLCC